MTNEKRQACPRRTDAPTIAIAAIGLALIALGAALLPAWRAARLDPNAVLRVE